MVKLTIVEDRPTPKEVYNWKVYTFACLACWASVMIGYDSAFIGTSISLKSFRDEFGLTGKSTSTLNTLSANIVSTYQGGCFFGALSGYPIGYWLGRKWGLTFCAIIFCVGAVLQVVASSKTGLGIMYAGRFIVGWGVGVASNLTPIYIAEISPPAIRGRLIGLYEAGWQIGAVVGFWINYGISKHIPYGNKQWVIPFAVQLIPGGMLAIAGALLTESPRWLASKNRNAQALKNLAFLRNLPDDHTYVREEMAEIEMAHERDQAAGGAGFMGPLRTLFRSNAYLKRLAIAVSLFAMQNGTGINAINYYSPTVFKSIGVAGTNTSLLTTGIFGLIKFLGAIIWLLYLVDRFGRKAILMIGAAGGAFSMYYIGAYIAIAKPQNNAAGTPLSSGGTSAIAFFYIWTIFYSASFNGTPWVYGAEIMPTFVRAATQAVISASNWLFAFLIARFTPQMFAKMGFGVYMFFASMMVVSIPLVYLIIPETSGVPLEKMNDLFELPARKAHIIIRSQLERAPATPEGGYLETEDEKAIDQRVEYV